MTSARQVLSLHALQFSHLSEQPLFYSLSCVLHAGRKIALTGPNGVGKSTLLRIIAGELEAESGQIHVTASCRLLHQHLLENARSEISELSGGQGRILILRQALRTPVELLLLDEPTNDLDGRHREELRARLVEFSGALLIASHDPLVLDAVDEIWELNRGTLTRHPPGYESYLQSLEEEELRKSIRLASLEAERKKVAVHARQVSEAQQRRMARGQRQGIDDNLPKIVRGAKKRQAERTLAKLETTHDERVAQVTYESREVRDSLRRVSAFRWDADVKAAASSKRVCCVEEWRLENARESGALSFELRGRERLQIEGPNASGKTTLLRAIAGDPEARRRARGKASVGVPVALFDQKLDGFSESLTIYEHFAAQSCLEMSIARQRLGRAGFAQKMQDKQLASLSGGERVRLHLLALLARRPAAQLLLLDEPTNHLDLESRRILLEFIQSFPGALILVSHDRRFVAECEITRVVKL